ncbi:MAG: DNA double-strand break repair nuclease NurA [Anaerolineaceae bacterium]|nr:DNA double-strand break repair nuclease NurA [Anaerolineaceae bacterium]
MPVNFIEIRSQITEMGKNAKLFEQQQNDLREQARQTFNEFAERIDLLCETVEKAKKENSKLRCAVPVEEGLTFSASSITPEDPYALLAADGSQVNPSRHDSIQFSVINVGAIRMYPGQPEAPREFTRTRLLYHDDLYTSTGPLTEGDVALRRDLNERLFLAELAGREETTVIALTDGPLELYYEARESPEFIKNLQKYLDALHSLKRMNAAAAGYVDRPRGDLVIRLLELMILDEEDLSQTGRQRPLQGVTDEELFREILEPGQRSAIFAIQSISAQKFAGALSLHFFYLNVGRVGYPSLGRVEIPAWVASDMRLVNLLHSALVAQCQQMGSQPYPYALHRAHEIAVVSFDEKSKVQNMIALELYQHGVQIGESSPKQASKETMHTRKRHQI